MKIQSSMFRHVAEKHAKILKQEHVEETFVSNKSKVVSKESNEIVLVDFSDEEVMDEDHEDYGYLDDHVEENDDYDFEVKNESTEEEPDLPLTQPIKLKIQKTLFSTDEDDQGLEETPNDSPKSVENDEQQDNFPGSIFQV